jgi:putative ABC transport system substrate-binding protein
MRTHHWTPARFDPVRRTLIGTAVALAAPQAVLAQPVARKVRLAFLGGTGPDSGTMTNLVGPFRLGMRELGYVEGQNLTIEFRWGEGQPVRLPALLAELIQLDPDVLVTSGPGPALVAKDATSSLPVVAVAVDDPVQMGLAASFARPGRNFTGVSAAFSGILAKRLQLLKDFVPSARQFAVLYNPHTAQRTSIANDIASYERTLGVPVVLLEARGPDDFDAAFASIERDRVDAVAILADATFWTHRARLAELCLKHRLPSVWGHKSYLDVGGLVSYQGDFAAMFRRSAALVDKILKGTKPGDIAFEQATKLNLVVNRKAAKALGLTIPQNVLMGADELID